MKKYITIILLFFVTISVGQRKFAADKYFKKFAYIKSAELYKEIYKKGDSSKLVLSRLADSYYFNTNTEDSEFWYSKLFKLYENENISPEYYFRYAQSLKGNEKYKESDTWLLKLEKIKNKDSRVIALMKKTNYFEEYSNKEKTFVNIHNVSTNTEYSDYGVAILKDKVLFSSTRPEEDIKKSKLYRWNKQPFLNIYEAKDSLQSNEMDAKVLDFYGVKKLNNINSDYHEASAIVTKDGKTMYFTRDNYNGKKLKTDKKRTTHLKIYRAELIGNQWGNITELSFNSDDFSTGHPALSVDEKELYFVSDMPGGFGATDLYKVTISNTGTFGEPENLGNKINTEGREMFPYISAKNVLYFSSDGHIGLGALDIFESKINPNEYGNPSNLGSPINSNRDDFSFAIVEEQTKGYFSSNRKGGKGDDDIYSFTVYRCNEKLEGVVYDSITKKVVPLAEVQLIDEEGKIIKSTLTNQVGFYDFGDVSCEKKYTVIANKKDYKSGSSIVETLDIDKKVIKADITIIPLIIENQIVINPIFFDFDKSKIRPDAEYELEHIITVMKNNPNMVIKIESHTDARGEKDYNRKLSDRRAKSTRDYIVSRGISANRIASAIGYGEDQLLNDCNDANIAKCTKEQHQKNRRSYFYILKK